MDASEVRVQETANDAAISKLSAVHMGYVNDPFQRFFVSAKFQRRSPLINRGYFARISAVDLILRRFVACATAEDGSARCQIISLGCGMDTAFFRALSDRSAPSVYFEVDFPDVTARKAELIRTTPVLLAAVGGTPPTPADLAAAASPPSSPAAQVTPPAAAAEGSTPLHSSVFTPLPGGGTDVHAAAYRLVTADLRDVAALSSCLAKAGLDPALPTLLLSECVLVYLEPEDSCAIIAWAARTLLRSAFVTYEQIRPHDAFGQVMARNLEERGYALRGLHAFPDPPSQAARYRELGYGAASCADMNDIYYRLLPRPEVARVERLELFDELEEWHLMSAHYAIAVAVNEVGGALPPPAPSPARGAAWEVRTPSTPSVGTHASAFSPPLDAPLVLSPRQLAEAVVHSHEEGGRPSLGGSVRAGRSSSPRPSPFTYATTAGGVRSAARSRSASLSHSATWDVSPHTPQQGTVTLSLGATGAAVDFDALGAAEEEMAAARGLREAAGIDVLRDTGEDLEDTASVASASAMSLSMSRTSTPAGHGMSGGSAMGPPPALMPPPPRSPAVGVGGEGEGGPGASPTPRASHYGPALEASRSHSLAAALGVPRVERYDSGSSIREAVAAGRTVSLYDLLLPIGSYGAGIGGRPSLGGGGGTARSGTQ
jgi:tRNA wybutosine-synthesizing protein 4